MQGDTTHTFRIGAHTSAAGGVHKAAEDAFEIGCNTLQIFTRSPRMWRGNAPKKESIERLYELRSEHDLNPLAIHGSYLTNLAASDAVVLEKSLVSFQLELANAQAVGADFLIIHPGSARGQTTQEAIDVFANCLAASDYYLKTQLVVVQHLDGPLLSWLLSVMQWIANATYPWDFALTLHTASKQAMTFQISRDYRNP